MKFVNWGASWILACIFSPCLAGVIFAGTLMLISYFHYLWVGRWVDYTEIITRLMMARVIFLISVCINPVITYALYKINK